LLPPFADDSTTSAVKSAGRQFRGKLALADAEPLAVTAPGVCVPVVVRGLDVLELDAALAVAFGVPSPSVPAPPVGWEPPVSTVLLAWMMACRKGWTPSETLAMTATPASTITGRSQLMAAGRCPAGARRSASVRGSRGEGGSPGDRRRSLGKGRAVRLVVASGQARWTWPAQWACHDRGRCQSQCPRQVQFRARLAAPAITLSNQG
jgi:hypothetical protein